MAESPSHKFGQMIGNLLEDMVKSILEDFCEKHDLYLDSIGYRRKVRSGRKVRWRDKYGNLHDLDFVIEKNGSKNKKGRPVAFVEVAWRRYTRHSRNKAQEIQGAVLPIVDSLHWDKPFFGAILAGEFTQDSIRQLTSSGFEVLHIPYSDIISAFESVGINAKFSDSTSDEEFLNCVESIKALDSESRENFKSFIRRKNHDLFSEFKRKILNSLNRMLDYLVILPIPEGEHRFTSFDSALSFVDNLDANNVSEFQKYEVIAKYSNGDLIDESLKGKEDALNFLVNLSKN